MNQNKSNVPLQGTLTKLIKGNFNTDKKKKNQERKKTTYRWEKIFLNHVSDDGTNTQALEM